MFFLKSKKRKNVGLRTVLQAAQALNHSTFNNQLPKPKLSTSVFPSIAFVILFRPIDPISQNVQQWLLGARN